MSEKIEIIESLGQAFFVTTYKVRVVDETLLEEIGCEIVAMIVPVPYGDLYHWRRILERYQHLTSPNLVRVLCGIKFHDQIVLLTEFLTDDLLSLMGPIPNEKDRSVPPIPIEKALQITCGILNGLAVIHQEGFFHGRIRPENIIMDGDVPKLSIPNFSPPLEDKRIEPVAMVFNSLYDSPEGTPGTGSMSSDIWATGVVLYEMLTGVLPFGIGADTSTSVIFERICKENLLPPSHYADIPPEIDAIVLDALRKDSQERIASAEAFLARLDALDQSDTQESSTGVSKQKSAGKAIGIDFGLDNSVVAYVRDDGPEVLYNRQGELLTPSVVGYRCPRHRKGEARGQILVGKAALKNYPRAPADTILSIRRLMGIGYDDPEVENVRKSFQYEVIKPSQGTEDAVHVVMGGRTYSPEDIAGMIFSQLKADAEERLREPVTRAVITVPAYFDQARQDAVRRAGMKAGLKVLELLDESSAAAMAYGVEEAESGEPKFVVVYDLSSDTFEASVVMCHGGTFVPLDIEGDRWLGGDNFDQEIINYVVDLIKKDDGVDPTENNRFMHRLKQAAREVRESQLPNIC